MDRDALSAAFTAYYATFPKEEMNDLKLEHTRRVVANAELVARGEAFPESLQESGLCAAWLHDLGRFRQYQQYRTFSDRHSVNHALLSCAEVLRLGWLDDRTPEDRNRILRAIEYHNLRDLPTGMTHEEKLLAQLVRDADKLDIFTLLDQAIATDYLPSHPEVYWGLPFTAPLSESIVAAIEAGESIDYAAIRSFADFVFIQLAWCNGGLHFAASARLAVERREVAIRQAYLTSIIPASATAINHCCAIAQAALERQAGHGA